LIIEPVTIDEKNQEVERMIRVMLADDQVLLRNSLKFILQRDEAIKVVGEASEGQEVLALCEKETVDVVLLDIIMPNMDGIETAKLIKEHYPSIKVIILTTFENIENITESFLAGADGYIVKDIAPDELILVVKCVYKGLCVIHESVQRLMIHYLKQGEKKADKNRLDMQGIEISGTEREIIKLVAQGKNNKEIAQIMNFAEGTIKNKITKLLEKLMLRDRLQIAIFAIENNLI